MWPKVLAQLIPQMLELLPHLKRVVPMAEKFLSSKAATERASEAALAAMAEGMRGDLGQMVSAHSGLYRKMDELDARLSEVGVEAKRSRMGVEGVEARLKVLEKAMAGYRTMGIAVLVMLAVVLILLLLIAVHVGLGR